MPGHFFECNPRMKSQHEGTLTPQFHPQEKVAGSKYSSTSGLLPCEQLEQQAEFHASTQDEACLSCPNSARTLRLESEMERNPEVPASTGDEALFIPAAMLKESRGAPCNAQGHLTSMRRHERVLQVDTQPERNHKLPATSPRKPRISPLHMT